MKLKSIFLWMCIMSTVTVVAQKRCKDVLNRADKMFQQGQIQQAIKTCEPCLNQLRTDEEKFEAYRLLGISYQFMNNKRKSEYYVEKMVRMKPDYYRYPNIDPVEFTKLINRYHLVERAFGGIKTGMNYATPTILKNYSPFNLPSKYYLTTGYQFGLFGEYLLKKNISIGTDLLFNGVYIDQDFENVGGSYQSYKESQQYLLLLPNITFTVHLPNNIKAYSGAGLGMNFMLNAMVNIETKNEITGVSTVNSKDAIDERNRAQFCSSIKIGFGIPVGKGMVAVDMSYMVFFRNLMDETKRYSDLSFIFNNQYINDDIKLTMFMFNLSYQMPIYSVIEIRK